MSLVVKRTPYNCVYSFAAEFCTNGSSANSYKLWFKTVYTLN